MTDFRDRFGIELDGAARRLARDRSDFRARFAVSLTEAAVSLAPTPERSRRRRSLPRLRMPRLAHPLAVALSLTVLAGAAAAASIWLPQLGNPTYGYNPGVNNSPPPADQLAALGVLRAPQTATDRAAASTGVLTYVNNYAHGVRTGYIRLLGQDATATYLLIPVAHRDAGPATPNGIDDALCVYAEQSQSATGPYVRCFTIAQVEAARGNHGPRQRRLRARARWCLVRDGDDSRSCSRPRAGDAQLLRSDTSAHAAAHGRAAPTVTFSR